MEGNNLSLFLDEAKKERDYKNFCDFIRAEKKRLEKVRKIKSVIKLLSAILLLLMVYIISNI